MDDKILNLKKQVSEKEFEVRNLENKMKEELNVLKTSLEEWKKLGILSEEQVALVEELEIEDIKYGKLDKFMEIYQHMNKIVGDLDKQIDSLEIQLKQIASM